MNDLKYRWKPQLLTYLNLNNSNYYSRRFIYKKIRSTMNIQKLKHYDNIMLNLLINNIINRSIINNKRVYNYGSKLKKLIL